jgi:DNA-binding Lrp family transcriptional regulator
MSKELVSYRIKRLVKNKIILNFSVIINFERLGYTLMQTHYKFINVNLEKKEEIIHFLVTNRHTMYVSLIEGIYDLQVEFYMGKPQEIEKLMDDIREKYSSYLIFKLSKFPIRAEFYPYSFLINNDIKKKQIVNWIWGQQLYDIDNLDFKILSALSKNSKIQLKNLANNLNSTVLTINNRINKMEKENIIAQYVIYVDWSKLGYRWFHLQISLKDYTKKNKIINYMRENPYLIRRFKFLDLDMDLHFTLLLKNMQQLRTIIEELSTAFPNSINDYHFYSTFQVYKHNFMVPGIIKNKNPFNRSQSF